MLVNARLASPAKSKHERQNSGGVLDRRGTLIRLFPTKNTEDYVDLLRNNGVDTLLVLVHEACRILVECPFLAMGSRNERKYADRLPMFPDGE